MPPFHEKCELFEEKEQLFEEKELLLLKNVKKQPQKLKSVKNGRMF